MDFKIDINYADTTTFTLCFKCKPHLSDTAGFPHYFTNLRIGE